MASTWLQVSYCDLVVAQMQGAAPRWREAAERRWDRAHRRHLAAMAAMTTVRKLLPAGSEATALAAEVSALAATSANERPAASPAVVAYTGPADRPGSRASSAST